MTLQQIHEQLSRIETKIDSEATQILPFPKAAEYLGLSRSTLYGMTSRGEIAHFKPNGKKISFLKSDLDAYLTRNRIKPREEIRAELAACQ
jgi:excisionase family DNA binding protein